MMTNVIKTSIKMVYGMLWEVLALYEKTEGYNKVPMGVEEEGIWDFMGNELMAIRKEINCMFLGEDKLREKLLRIVEETEYFVRSNEQPGVVTRWKRINPRIMFFDCVFDVMEENPELYEEISWGLSELKFSCYPNKTLVAARNRYFTEIRKRIKNDNLRYSDERVFQDEIQRTLTLVFENDFKEYL